MTLACNWTVYVPKRIDDDILKTIEILDICL